MGDGDVRANVDAAMVESFIRHMETAGSPRAQVAMAELRTLRAQRDAVLREHSPDEDGTCCTCTDSSDNHAPWPCPTAAALGVSAVTE